MDNMNLESDLCMSGMTLRCLLENRDLLSVSPRVAVGKEDRVSADIYADVAAAFIGPNMWDKTLQDFKADYIDLDSLLGSASQSEIQQKILDCATSNKDLNVPQLMQLETTLETANAQLRVLPACNTVPQIELETNSQSPPSVDVRLQEQESKDSESSAFSANCKFSPTDLALATTPGHTNYDPTSKIFPVEELKPQPIMKKSRKHFVPDSLKDDKYWARRRKNNIAAKRSREARRLKENQIVLRASYLEKENNLLKEDVMRLKAENDMLKIQLKEFQHS